ncbi:MAG: hypothetical protein KDC48_10040, partial [Planctomycetes bacterium]|nr:hypothetical protein [Planctomycetota bacterium]
MTNNEPKESGEQEGRGRKPRGMGGVILILALLMALFLVVSRSELDGHSSVHAFYSHLLNGRLQNFAYSDGVVTAEIRSGNTSRPIEVVVRDFLRGNDNEEIKLYSTLAAQKLDTTTYPPGQAGSVARFLGDLEQGRFQVQQAFLVDETAAKSSSERPKDERDPRKEGTYLTALLQGPQSTQYVRLDPPPPGSSEPSLLDVTSKLRAADVPVRAFHLSLGANDFKVTEPNTAMLYILGTVGPWLLVLAIIWFFILRQMRSPGGTGGVLSFGRSRAALYTKENRTNVTFDDVAGMEEAKAEVREIIE